MNTHPVSKQFLDNFKFMPLANVWPVERWGEKLLGGDSGVVGWGEIEGFRSQRTGTKKLCCCFASIRLSALVIFDPSNGKNFESQFSRLDKQNSVEYNYRCMHSFV